MTIHLLNNRYQVIRTLGTGGFGETYLAEDTYMPSKCQVNKPQVDQFIRVIYTV